MCYSTCRYQDYEGSCNYGGKRPYPCEEGYDEDAANEAIINQWEAEQQEGDE